jgi:hypothetical protein
MLKQVTDSDVSRVIQATYLVSFATCFYCIRIPPLRVSKLLNGRLSQISLCDNITVVALLTHFLGCKLTVGIDKQNVLITIACMRCSAMQC